MRFRTKCHFSVFEKFPKTRFLTKEPEILPTTISRYYHIPVLQPAFWFDEKNRPRNFICSPKIEFLISLLWVRKVCVTQRIDLCGSGCGKIDPFIGPKIAATSGNEIFAPRDPHFLTLKESGPKRNAKFSIGPLLQCFFAKINFLTLFQIQLKSFQFYCILTPFAVFPCQRANKYGREVWMIECSRFCSLFWNCKDVFCSGLPITRCHSL